MDEPGAMSRVLLATQPFDGLDIGDLIGGAQATERSQRGAYAHHVVQLMMPHAVAKKYKEI